MSINVNKKAVLKGLLLELQTARKGVVTVLPQGMTLTLGGQPYLIPALLAKIDAESAVHTDVQDLRTSLSQKIADRNAQEPEQRTFLDDLEAAVKGYLGVSNASLVDFGYKPKTAPAKPTPEERVTRQQKAKATREKNHPKGGASSISASPTATKP